MQDATKPKRNKTEVNFHTYVLLRRKIYCMNYVVKTNSNININITF